MAKKQVYGGDLLRAWRGARSYAQAAEVLGITKSYIWKLERRDKRPSIDTAAMLERQCGVPMSSWGVRCS
jgi:transcriptional regulator with XRE-family HTH domain